MFLITQLACADRKDWLSLLDLARLDAAGADADPLGGAVDQSLHCLQIDIPAALGHVVRVRNVVAELRSFAANLTYLCHLKAPNLSQVSAPA